MAAANRFRVRNAIRSLPYSASPKRHCRGCRKTTELLLLIKPRSFHHPDGKLLSRQGPWRRDCHGRANGLGRPVDVAADQEIVGLR